MTIASCLSSTEDSKNRKQKNCQIEIFSESIYLKTALILREACQSLKYSVPSPLSASVAATAMTTDSAQNKNKLAESVQGVFHTYLVSS